jgi:mannose-1-phosphate guanylyltransferase/mannose-6-phosphate isomerase
LEEIKLAHAAFMIAKATMVSAMIVWMIVVIIAGGSGTRLWPLSTADYPKHLLKLTNERSLLQNTYDRVSDFSDDVFVITEKSHSKYVIKQLPGLQRRNFLIEPARRGTASCVILALAEIRRRKLSNQAILFLWADHLIQDKSKFAASAKQAAELAEKEERPVFLGVEPTFASTGFGYMQKGKSLKKDVFELKQFVEKPDKKTAEKYLKSKQYLWNTGYLMGTLQTFERELMAHAPRLWNDYQSLCESVLPMTKRRIYLSFVSEAIDYALSEHIPDALLVPGKFDWADVGSFHDLHGASAQDKQGNYIKGEKIEIEEVKDSYVRNEGDIPVAVIGVENVAVIATDNGILVTNKAAAQKVGDIAKKLQKDKKNFKWLEKLEKL